MNEENGESKKILLVESVFGIRSTLEERFRRKKGWEVMAAGSGKEALKACASFEPDLIVLDRELCDMDGKDALYSMMSVQSPLIVLLSSKTDEADEVICLGMGVDAYLEKPVSERIVEAECMALFRRMDKTMLGYGKRAIRRGELYIDPSGREAEVGERKVNLTKTEFDILLSLAKRPGEALKREEIASMIQSSDAFQSLRFIDTHIKEIRKKIRPVAIRTVRGVGYALEKEEAERKGK
ncbi:MAG: response regulator transcription factor [Aeriscardovia sp.]|nr:response regulator transcription factor [Aeriscardovia sp.]